MYGAGTLHGKTTCSLIHLPAYICNLSGGLACQDFFIGVGIELKKVLNNISYRFRFTVKGAKIFCRLKPLIEI